MTDDLRTSGERSIHLTMKINFMSSKYSNEIRLMHIKSDNRKVIIGNDTDEIIENLFQTFFHRYQIGLKEPMRVSVFVFDHADGLHYKYQKISLNHGGSHIDSSE